METNKFTKDLTASNKEIKAARAKIVGEDVKDASEEMIHNLKKARRTLERRLLNICDMHRDSELSLKVVKDNFNATAWIKEIQEIKVELANNEVELSIAEATHKEWFGKIKEEVTAE